MIGKIHNEDCLETMKRMPDGFIDLVVTSPPYDGLRDYKGYSFDFESIAQELYRIIKPGGVLVWVVGDSVVNNSESGNSFVQALRFKDIGFNIHDTMIYEKSGSPMPDKYRYLQNFEYMFVLSKGLPKTVNFIKDRINRFPERWGKGRKVREKNGKFTPRKNITPKKMGRRFNIWRYVQGGGYSSSDPIAYQHPAIFPEKLARDHIYTWSNKDDLVYDPFGGSGTTVKMAHLMDRKWLMSEISHEYCKVSKERLQPYLKQQKLNLE